ncbi:Stk1 family PASTA domain-containing Ser/Thr kinase [Facklamia sp. DSM 111018]|uniref:non-specific serine/threonine protein kinase n=1 Tax=Facklamia lactis TaxID=2749967 RepID=A0ABS0LN19_9LACT|nr:Stk1 family PASTA domain-containing Ser/Thr kinase [Facklamia lactis]MBG9979798.1 Stk1 family PASTA domain-containing Ser/Thr kinase [Facklamia lactis]MBG9985522.1 Stk1 family PASTA domain-containing Ser/Thr kinase [Facklamia lactis]
MIEIGDKLSDRYVLNSLIGQGGMANVFLAHDLILDRKVAVKVLRYDFQENQDAIKRFQREAISASQLLHPNIVEVYDVDEHENQQYIVMEYVEGQDLKSFIKENAPVSLELVVAIMCQIVAGIGVAHRNRIIHRDIKPQNVMITKDNIVKITDFGIAVALSDTSITQTNTLLGSVHYLSPEQARGSSAATKSDIYAMGVVLYELITGKVPHDGESAVSIALKHFQEPFPRIREKLDYVPQSLENVVLRATAKQPQDRYKSAQDMFNDLSTCLSSNRINEQTFNPKSQGDESEQFSSIQPLSQAEKILAEQVEAPEPLNEELYPSFDQPNKVKFPSRGRIMRILFFSLISILLGLAIFFAYQFITGSVNVPDLAEMDQSQAEKVLSENDLSIGKTEVVFDESIPRGQIIETDPKAGERVDRNSSVQLKLSDGKPRVKIGDYVDKEYEPVRRDLIDAGFIVDLRYLASSQEESGKILEQNLEPGEEVVPEDTTITLVIGSYVEDTTMQDFYNLSIEMVHKFADTYGLYVEETYEYHSFIPEGQIIEQEPLSGSPIINGDTIKVTVSQGKEETDVVAAIETVYLEYVPKYAENDFDEEKPLPNLIQVQIGDERNNINEVAREFEITESEELQLTLYIPTDGTGQYRILRDGEVIAESSEVYPATEE